MRQLLLLQLSIVTGFHVEPRVFRKRVATYQQVIDHIAIGNSDASADLVITLTGNNSFWYNYETPRSLRRKSPWFEPDWPFIDDNKTIEEDPSHMCADEILEGMGRGPRLQTIEQIARQIKAGRAKGILAKLTEEGMASLAGMQKAGTQCGPMCAMKHLTAQCKSQMFASEHLRMFSIQFERETCTLEDIIFVLELMGSNPNVDFMEVDGIVNLHLSNQVAGALKPGQLPNDPFYPHQWSLPYIDAPSAWEIFSGRNASRHPTIMVVDTGVDYTHPDLRASMWVNEKELYGEPGVDDDNNGYVDDIYGINSHSGTGDPMDDDGHGTHCAGSIGAATNNTRGVSGVHWGPKIMACKFITKDSGTYGDAIKCIDYALRMGADLISNSWGGGPESSILKHAIQRAGEKNVMFVMSAGNSGKDLDETPTYPASYKLENTLSVGAVDEQGLADYSNYGRRSVEMAAPGTSILSTTPNDTYAYFSGTSMAAPIVSGLSALMLAINPTLTPVDIKWLIRNTLDHKDFLKSKFVWGGTPNAGKLIAETAGPTFFFPTGGWRPWRVARTIIAAHSAARIPIVFTAREPGMHRGSLVIRQMKRHTITGRELVNIELEAVDVPHLNFDILPSSEVRLRAYPGFESQKILPLLQRCDGGSIQITINGLEIIDEGDGDLTIDVNPPETFEAQSDGDGKNVTLTCSLKTNEVSKNNGPTTAELKFSGPIGLDSKTKEYSVKYRCEAVSLKFDPDPISSGSVSGPEWNQLTITKDNEVAFNVLYSFEEDSEATECSSDGGAGSKFKQYVVHKTPTKGFIDLAALFEARRPNVTRVDQLHGQDDKHVKVAISQFQTFHWFDKRLTNLTDIYVSTNGVFSFTNWRTNNDWSPAIDAPVQGEPDEAVGPYWADQLSPPQNEQSQIYVLDTEDRLIVQWNQLSQYGRPEAVFTFQAHLTRVGHIFFAYKKIYPVETDPKKLNIGIKHGSHSVSLNVTEFDPDETILIERQSQRKGGLSTKLAGVKSGPLGVLEWPAEETSLTVPIRFSNSAGCQRVVGALDLVLFDPGERVAVVKQVPIDIDTSSVTGASYSRLHFSSVP